MTTMRLSYSPQLQYASVGTSSRVRVAIEDLVRRHAREGGSVDRLVGARAVL